MAEVVWTKLATQQLEKAIRYIADVSYVVYAQKVLDETLTKTEKLEEQPFLGQKEPNLTFKKLDYRYLVVWSYKIIYRVNKAGNKVYIVRYFHTSQNPSKMF